MADLKKAQDEAIALVDTAKAMMDKVLTVMDIFVELPTLSVNYTVNPMEYLMKLLKAVGITDKEIKDFVSSTYSEVFAAYTQEHLKGGIGPSRSEFDKKFLSKRLQKAINSEEMIDCDYWVQAQDFTTPVFDIKDVHATDEKSGYADIEIRVFGPDSEPSGSRVQVKIEDGKWKIDDFQYKNDNGQYVGW